jgi:dTDP-4-dehydrorhamnose reductase
MTVLIVGGSGFLGTELVRQASAAGHLTAATFATRPVSSPEATWYDLDLRDGDRVEEVVSSLAPCMSSTRVAAAPIGQPQPKVPCAWR